MKFTTALSSLLLAVPAFAQTTPAGFAPAANTTLDVYYGTQYISPGLVVKKSSMNAFFSPQSDYPDKQTVTQKAPVIGLTNTTLAGKYLLAMIGTSPSPSIPSS